MPTPVWPYPWFLPERAPLNTQPLNVSEGAYYKVLAPLSGMYRRTITASQNSTAQAFFFVPWADRAQFEIDALGKSDWVAGQKYLKRRLPLRYGDPADNTLYLERLTSDKFVNITKQAWEVCSLEDGQFSEGWMKSEMASYIGDFSQVAFLLKEDSEVSSKAVPELERYLFRTDDVNAYHRKVPSYRVAFDSAAGTNCPVLQSLPEYTIRFFYVSYRWPIQAVPKHVMADTLGYINDADFDTSYKLYKADGSVLNGFPKGQLLYENYRLSMPYHGSDGTSEKLYVDRTDIFLWNLRGWNYFVNPAKDPFAADAGYEQVQWTNNAGAFYSPARRPYKEKNFNRIYWPAGAT